MFEIVLVMKYTIVLPNLRGD